VSVPLAGLSPSGICWVHCQYNCALSERFVEIRVAEENFKLRIMPRDH